MDESQNTHRTKRKAKNIYHYSFKWITRQRSIKYYIIILFTSVYIPLQFNLFYTHRKPISTRRFNIIISYVIVIIMNDRRVQKVIHRVEKLRSDQSLNAESKWFLLRHWIYINVELSTSEKLSFAVWIVRFKDRFFTIDTDLLKRVWALR